MTLGRKIRELRQAKDWSLADLAKRSGVGLSTLSRIETGRMTGTLESHVAIARSLGARLAELYATLEPAGLAAELARPDEGRAAVVTARGTTLQLLTSATGQKKMLVALFTLPPRKGTREEKGPAGSEKFLYVLKGEMQVAVSREKHRVKTGEGLYFQAALAHSFLNVGTVAARALLVSCPPAL